MTKKKANENDDKSTTLQSIIQDQLTSLDDSDCYASAWAQAQAQALSQGKTNVNFWGGRGKGGRGLARRTVQPHDIVLERVSLEYISDTSNATPHQTLLDGGPSTVLKLLGSHIYAIVGRNGCGKSTLLRRIFAKKIPGFASHLTTMYIPQEVFGFGQDDVSFTFTAMEDVSFFPNINNNNNNNDDDDDDDDDDSNSNEEEDDITPMSIAKAYYNAQNKESQQANQFTIQQLEQQMELLDLENEDDCATMETICEQIATLDEEDDQNQNNKEEKDNSNTSVIMEALEFFAIPPSLWDQPMTQLSGGIRKKVLLACALICNPDVLMLDEPTNHLDIPGIFQLRQLISTCTQRKTTVVIVSHDVDLVNDVATDVIHFWQKTLFYYPGNYSNFLKVKHTKDLHQLRQQKSLELQRGQMVKSIQNLKVKKTGNPRGDKKLKRAIESKKKKLEKHGIQKDAQGHRWTMQNSGTGMKVGSINAIDSSSRKKLSYTELLKRAETNVAPVPDKAVQFIFRDPTSTWGEPLITAMDVGHGYHHNQAKTTQNNDDNNNEKKTVNGNPMKKNGMLFDCIDLCINEGSRTCILGTNGSGKSTLLKVLAKMESPLEGTIHHAHGVGVGYFHQHIADDLIQHALSGAYDANAKDKITTQSESTKSQFKANNIITSLSLLQNMFPFKTEQDLRGELASFGLHANQVTTNIKYLSGGERCRLCLCILMLKDPQVLLLDEPTNHLDVESVDALIYGIQKWKGTLIVVSHDANFIRMIGGDCFLLMEEEGKLRRIPNGIDFYLEHFFTSDGQASKINNST